MREGRPRLVVTRGEDRGEEIELPEGEIRIGRGRQSDIMLKDLSVSRHHATVFFDGRRVRARDEGSGNGTIKNGAQIEGETDLTDGDQLEMGETTFRLDFPRVIVDQGPPARIALATREPERNLKPFIMIAGGVLALALVGVAAVSLLSGRRPDPAPPPEPAVAEAPAAAPAPTQPPPIVISMPAAIPAAPDAGVARSRDRGRDRDKGRDRNKGREHARDRRDRDFDRVAEPVGDREDPAVKPKAGGAAREAQQLYEAEDYGGAARTLRDSGDEALAAVAKDYATVGAGLARGDANKTSNPMIALTAYQEALAADIRSGDSVHASLIRERLGAVAPAAARAFFDIGRYEHARAACDIAVNLKSGGDPRISQTRELLEGAAADLFRRAQALESSDQSEAELLYRRILKIVPSDNDWARKALAALRG